MQDTFQGYGNYFNYAHLQVQDSKQFVAVKSILTNLKFSIHIKY